MSRLIDVYPYKKEDNGINILLFKRAENVKYAGQWRMIGGKVHNDERATEAALRELKEESGLQPKEFWVIPSVNQFYDPQTDNIQQIPAFAAELEPDAEIILNHEHIDYIWISEDEIDEYINWTEQKRLLKLVSTIVTDNKILKEWII